MTSRTPFIRALVPLALATFALACGDTPTAPENNEPTIQHEVYTGQLVVGGSQFYSFNTATAGTTEITLTGVRPVGSPAGPIAPSLGMGVGQPQGTDCALSSAITTSPGLTKQLSVSTNISTYCVKITDVGGLTGPVDYTVRVVHP